MSNTITVQVTSSVSTGPTSGYLVVPGDFTLLFFPGFKFSLFNQNVVPYPQSIPYTVVSSALVAGNTQITVSSAVYGSVVSISPVTPGTGPFVSGTYNGVTLTGGHGQGAQVTVVNVGPGPIATFGPITGGSGYNNATYNAVPLTVVGGPILTNSISPGSGYTDGTYPDVPLLGGSGSGAAATLTVVGGVVTGFIFTNTGVSYLVGDILTINNTLLGGGTGFSTQVQSISPSVGSGALATVNVTGGFIVNVQLTNAGTGYEVGSVMTANNVDLGGAGSSFSVPVTAVNGTIQSVTLTNAGVTYQVGDVLTFGGFDLGTGNTVTVDSVTSTEVGSIRLNNTQPMFNVNQQVYVINEVGATCRTAWWWNNPNTPQVPAVESGTVLGIDVNYTNSATSPTVTYQIRIGNQPGVAMLDQSFVFIDKPTAITAYEAMVL